MVSVVRRLEAAIWITIFAITVAAWIVALALGYGWHVVRGTSAS